MSSLSANHPDIPATEPDKPDSGGKNSTRRDFLYLATGSVAVVATGAVLWPLIDTLNPTADVKALSVIEVDLKEIELGARITVMWSQRPIFIDHRTPERIALARVDDNNMSLIDPALDSDRAQRAQWLVQIGICTHLGCIPLGQKDGDPTGAWSGWFCPCHGSVYDAAGRVRKGPAPRNLDLPPYEFLSDTLVRIG